MGSSLWKMRSRAVIVIVFVALGNISNEGFALEPQAIAKRAFPSVVLITMKDNNDQPVSLGSGFVVQKDIVATNLHVIRGSTKGLAKLVGQDRELAVTGVVAFDEKRDLVLLKVALDAPPLAMNYSHTPEVGQTVYAVGNPQGLEGTFSQGIVSGIRNTPEGRWVQITAPISPGSSGGPILDSQGDVIGIAVATLQSGQNINFAIPVRALTELIRHAHLTQSLASAQAQLISRGGNDREGIGRNNEGGEFDIRSGIGLHSPLWNGNRSDSKRSHCTYSISNKLATPVAGFKIVINFYSETGAQLYSTTSDIWDVVVPAGSSHRQLWGCYADPSVQTLAKRIEMRLLDYSIWDEQMRCRFVTRQFTQYRSLYPTKSDVCNSNRDYGAKAIGIAEEECLRCLNER